MLALGGLDEARVAEVAREQALDAVFDLLRWPEGDFAFVIDEPLPAGPPLALAVAETVEEGQRRVEAWRAVARTLPSPGPGARPGRHARSDPRR